MKSLQRTVRVIGVALAAGGRSVDFALIETDGGSHVRHVETERQILLHGPVLDAVVQATRRFMGDRALQPFAVDLIALAEETAELTVSALGAGTTVDSRLGCLATRGGTRAEQAAFSAVAALVAEDAAGTGR